MGRMARDPYQRFVEKCGPADKSGCIPWIGSTFTTGHGSFFDPRENRSIGAHRWVYEYFRGRVPGHLEVMHACHNASCVNINHLSVGTPSENVRQTVQAKRWRGGGKRALTDEQVYVVDAIFGSTPKRCGRSQMRLLLARKLGVSGDTIQAAYYRQGAYANIPK